MTNQNDKYFEKLTYTLGDKIFFLDHIENPRVFIDFGCAMAELGNEIIEYIGPVDWNPRYIGYDRTAVIERAKKGKAGRNSFITLTNDFEDLAFLIKNNDQDNNVLILSSVLHEIYSNNDQQGFWNIVRKLHPKYIAIRDMYYGGNPDSYAPQKYIKLLNKMYDYEYTSPKMKEIIEYILKYPHRDNWDHESAENYFSWEEKDVDFMMDVLGYKKTFMKKYTLPYFRDLVKEESEGEVDLDVTTHIQLIYERKDSEYPSLKFRKKHLSTQYME